MEKETYSPIDAAMSFLKEEMAKDIAESFCSSNKYREGILIGDHEEILE